MKTVNKNKKVFGVCKNGKVCGNPNQGVVNFRRFIRGSKYTNMSTTLKIGYETTIKIVATDSFKLYKIVNNQLVQVKAPVSNKLVVKGGVNTGVTRDSVLVYNGDGTFSIGSYNYYYPRDAKSPLIFANDIYVGILDANDNPFYTDTDIFSFSRSTANKDFSGYRISTYTRSSIESTIKNINIEINNELDMSKENALNGEYDNTVTFYYPTQWGPGESSLSRGVMTSTILTLKSVYK